MAVTRRVKGLAFRGDGAWERPPHNLHLGVWRIRLPHW